MHDLEMIKETLSKAKPYMHAARVLQYDMETICPQKAMEEQGEVSAFLSTEGYRILKDPAFIEAAERAYAKIENGEEAAIPVQERVLLEELHRDYEKEKNVTPEHVHKWQTISSRAYVRWLEAKQKKDFSIFAPSLREAIDAKKEKIALREERKEQLYDDLLNDYERGVGMEDIDAWFGEAKEFLLPFLEKIRASKKVIRTDFLSRPVEIGVQEKMAKAVLTMNGFDFTRGALTTTEHPFMSGIARNDIRITTHYYPDMFVSNLYSVMHEGGHALFSQMIPEENYDYHIEDAMTTGMHESVSRFYENRIGRSRAYIHAIYPTIRALAMEALQDVTEEEFYEAVNCVEPSYIRIEADEFTYTLHIIIRYELEKAIFNGSLSVDALPEAWNDLYESYLGIRPRHDAEGVLQDMHWTSLFGYFPTYALGNMYNAMYYNQMASTIDIDGAVSRDDMSVINTWMREHVFAKACYLSPKEWILDITGRAMDPADYLRYLEEKYGALYGLA